MWGRSALHLGGFGEAGLRSDAEEARGGSSDDPWGSAGARPPMWQTLAELRELSDRQATFEARLLELGLLIGRRDHLPPAPPRRRAAAPPRRKAASMARY